MAFDPETREESSEQTALRLPQMSPVLSSGDLARIERHLREQHGELLNGIRRLEAMSAPTPASARGHHRTSTLDHEVAPVLILRGELDQTAQALTRLANGTYGICESCNGPIAPQRLSIIPSAVRCERCAAFPAARPAVH